MEDETSDSGSRKLKLFLVSVGAIVLLVGASAAAYYFYLNFFDAGESPERSLQNIALAVEKKDLSQFRKYVDVTTLSEQIVDDAFALVTEEMEKETKAKGRKNAFEAIGNSIALMFLMVTKPSISQMLRQQIEHFVETGEVKEIQPIDMVKKPNPQLEDKKPTVSIEKIQSATKTFKRIVNSKIEGNQAYLKLEFESESKEKQNLTLRLRNVEDRYWQLAEIVNFREFAQKNQIINSKQESNKKDTNEKSSAATSRDLIPEVPTKKSSPVKPKDTSARVITENANLRSLPSNDSYVLDTLSGGTIVSVQRQSGPWFRVDAGGISGWMHGDTIRITND